MDEPLSNLDAKLRVQMRNELTKLHRDLQTTFVFVTHDQIEAMTLATKIVVMNGGNIMQVDTPERIFNNPANLFVAGFIGSPQMNFLNGKYIEENGAFYFVRKDLKILIQNINFNCDIKSGREVILGIRPEYIQISNNNQSSAIHCTVNIIENMGSYQNIYCAFDEENIVIKVDASTKIALGDKINVELVKDKIQLFDKVSELSLYYEKR
jgi:multiple sugar transport system ATP-binding protein